MDKSGCGCVACAALLAECGGQVFGLYAKKLLYHGWAGAMTDAERAYRLAHSEQARKQAEQGAARAGLLRGTCQRRGKTLVADGLDGGKGLKTQAAMELG